ncbi:MAG: NAD(P)/FAD-dependent oxidoreductase [Burkholderiaceae bacterium]
MKLPRVVIIGGGFAGLEAARTLADAPVEVVLIDRTNHHTFQALLYQVASAGLAAHQIASPIRALLKKQQNCSVRLGTVESVDAAARSLRLADGSVVEYDWLIVAAGLTHSYFGNDEWEAIAPGLKTLDDAHEIRRRALLAFELAEQASDPEVRRDLKTFVVIGAGPTGVELAGALAELARDTLADDFRQIDPTTARVVLVEGGDYVLPSFPHSLSIKARRELESLGVEVHTGRRVTGLDREGVDLGEERIAARTVFWAAGVQGVPLGASLPAERDRSGRVIVTPALHLSQNPEIYVVGDLAHFDVGDEPLPAVAQVALQMGRHAARGVLAQIRGQSPASLPGFRYADRGSMATIGRHAAVTVLANGTQLSGVTAWLAWLFVHILFLIGFRNRLLVMIDWAWSYFTYQRHSRLILPETGEMPRRPPVRD